MRALAEAGPPDAAMHAVQLAPGDARSWAAVVLRRIEQESPFSATEAVEMDWIMRRATELDPREPQAWLARALVLERREDFSGAVEAIERAGSSEPMRRASARLFALAGRAAEVAPDNLALRGIPARDPQATERQLDLSAWYNCRLDEDPIPGDAGNTLEELPRGLQTFAGVAWDVRGMVQLGNKDRLRRFPLAVSGITVGAKCAALHFLHAAEFVQVPPGAEVGRYVVHYADAGRAEVPVGNGRELGDWWGEPAPTLEAAWRGTGRPARQKKMPLNLFKTTWTNPRPDVAITTLDFVSAGTVAAPFVVAISRE